MKLFLLFILIIIFHSITPFALTLTEAYDSAKIRSHILSGKRENVLVKKEQAKIILSDLFPSISLNSTSKYIKDLNKDSIQTSYAGNTEVEVDNTEYTFSAYLTMNYNLLDFGSGRLKYKNAIMDTEISKLDEAHTFQNIKLQILEAYTKCLQGQYRLANAEKLLKLKGELYDVTSRLNKAGKIDKVTVVDSALSFAEQNKQLSDIKISYKQSVRQLSALIYTEVNPDTEFEISIGDFDNTTFNVNTLPEIKIIKKQIRQKENEYDISIRSRLPSLNLFANYSLYNSSESNYRNAYRYSRPESSTVGFTLTMPIFEGGKKNAQGRALKHEISGLHYELKQKIHEKKSEFETIKMLVKSGMKNAKLSDLMETISDTRIDMTKALKENYSISTVDYINGLINHEMSELQFILLKVENMYNTEKLNIYASTGAK